MNGYERRTKAKKEAIIHAARELFSERGVTDVGVNEIATKARVSQVSIYNYFGDKNALAREVLQSYIETAIKTYEEILERDIPFSEKLKIILNKKHDAIIEVSRSYFNKYAWEDKTLQQIYKDVVHTKTISIYVRFIELGKKEGAINQYIPTDAILSYLLSSLSIMQNPDYLKTSNDYKMGILKLFLYGLVGNDH